MKIILAAIIVFGCFFILMSVRLIFFKKSEIRGTCASQNPLLLKEGITCGVCGKVVTSGNECQDTSKTKDSAFIR